MRLVCHSFDQGAVIPARFAKGKIGANGETIGSDNLNPALEWLEAPEGTRSFVLACLDDDVPTVFDERMGSAELPAYQPRRRFVHWVQPNIPVTVSALKEGALSGERKCCEGFGRVGINDYATFYGKTPAMGEVGTGYDGPCPPCFDSRWHYYRFMVIALDVEQLILPERFVWSDVVQAMQGHVLGADEWVGRYTLNPRLAKYA